MNDRFLGFVVALILCLAAVAVNESWSEHHSNQAHTPASSARVLGEHNASPTHANLPLRPGDDNKSTAGEESGTEFWPAFFGYRLKITDTLLVAFTALLAWSTWGLQKSTVGLQRAADEQARITNHLFAIDQRPWISIEKTGLLDDLHWDVNGCNLTFEFFVKNTGKSPAIKTLIVPLLFSAVGRLGRDEQHEIAIGQRRQRNNPFGLTVFPGQTIRDTFTTAISHEEIERTRLHFVAQGSENFFAISPCLVGCFRYQSVLTSDVHQTGFIFEISRSIPSASNSVAINLEAGRIPRAHLQMIRVFEDGITE